MNRERILITGAGGFVGGNLCRSFSDAGADVVACCRSHPLCGEFSRAAAETASIDLTAPDSAAELIAAVKPSVVINCAALSRIGACEENPTLAEQCNVKLVHNLCRALTKPAPEFRSFIQLSTDLVFDAVSAPEGGFLESASPKAASVYGRTKAEAEQVVLAEGLPGAVCRLSLVYGNTANGRGGFMDWILNGLRNQETLPLFTDEWRTPVFAGDIFRALQAIIERGAARTEVFHLSGSERINRFDFGVKAAEVFEFPSDTICPTIQSAVQTAAPRAADASLNHRHTASELGISFLDTASGLEQMRRELDAVG